jgi:hypothetical protein
MWIQKMKILFEAMHPRPCRHLQQEKADPLLNGGKSRTEIREVAVHQIFVTWKRKPLQVFQIGYQKKAKIDRERIPLAITVTQAGNSCEGTCEEVRVLESMDSVRQERKEMKIFFLPYQEANIDDTRQIPRRPLHHD